MSPLELSEIRRIQANPGNAAPFRVATPAHRDAASAPFRDNPIPANSARYGGVAGRSRAGRDSIPRPPDP